MNDETPTINTRRYETSTNVPAKDLTTAYRVAATLVVEHGDQYLPLFERLDREMTSRDEKRAIRDRAAEVSKGAKRARPESTRQTPY